MKFHGKLVIGAMIISLLAGCNYNNISESISNIINSNTQSESQNNNNESNSTNTSSVTNNSSSINNSSSTINGSSSQTSTPNSGTNETLQQGWTYSGTYYDNLTYNSATLGSELSKLITDTHKKNTSYDGLASLFKESDRDPNNPNKILWFYTGTSVSFSGFGGNVGDTNREHVFPKDDGKAFPKTSGPGSDGHHLRPTDTQLNSIRGSKSFGEVEQTTSNIAKQGGSTSYNSDKDKLCYTNSTYFYPGKGYRGQTARILFYVVSRWGSQYNLRFVDGSGSCKTIGDISTLLKWNLEEPVSETEIHRNNVVAEKQGNRNPFIDNPNFACSIYGGTSEKAKAACAKANQVTPPSDDNQNNDSSSNTSSPDISEGPSSDVSSPNISEDLSSSNNQESSDGYIPPSDGKTYALVTKESDLVENGKYIIACNSSSVAMGYLKGNQYAASVNVGIINNKITLTNEAVAEYTLSGVKDSYKLTCDEGVLGVTSVKKLSYTQGTNTWKITISDNIATILSTNDGFGSLQYNSGAPRFTTYTSGQQAVSLYKLI